MKVVQINSVCYGSTGTLLRSIQKGISDLSKDKIEIFSFYGRSKGFEDLKCEKFGNFFSFWFHVIINTIFDNQGKCSYLVTKKMIKRLKEEAPDIIHLHNAHGYYLNKKLFFNYIKNDYKGKFIWTVHDCWAITGHCGYFTSVRCNKWKNKGCYKCPQRKLYPISWGLDNSNNNYNLKRELFNKIENVTIVTVSDWLNEIYKKSFLKKYNIVTIKNGIDLTVFKPTSDESIYSKYKIPKNKKIVLGVSNIWEKRKGLEDFIKLSKKLSNEYVIVIIGLSKKQIKKLPQNIIKIKRTSSQEELVKLYSASYVFFNPSREETFSLVTAEAMACGIPSIVLDTSAVKDLINEKNGIVLSDIRISSYLKAIKEIEKRKFDKNQIIKEAKKYDKNRMIKEYYELYTKKEL